MRQPRRVPMARCEWSWLKDETMMLISAALSWGVRPQRKGKHLQRPASLSVCRALAVLPMANLGPATWLRPAQSPQQHQHVPRSKFGPFVARPSSPQRLNTTKTHSMLQ
eukprot:6248441-Prymnesium_polylepis.1